MKNLPFAVLLLLGLAAPAVSGEDPPEEALRLFRLREMAAAEEVLLSHLAAEREDVPAMKLLAEVCLRTERPRDAARIVERALAVAPDDPELIAGRWEAALAAGGWSEAARKRVREEVDALRASCAPGGDRDRRTAAFLGYDLLDAKERKAELRREMADLFADDPPAALEGDLLEAVIVSRDAEERVGLVRTFERLFPDSKQINYLREILLWVVRDDPRRLFSEAAAILRKDPENRRARAALARWLLDQDPPDARRAAWQIGRALTLLDSPREIDRPALMSDEDWRRRIEETRGRYLALLGKAQHLLGRDEEAARTLSFAAEILPHSVGLHLTLGDVRKVLGDEAGAAAAWTRAAESGPSPEAEERLGGRPEPWFTDVTEAAGLAKAGGSRYAAGDVNGDGFPDLLCGGSRLFLNGGDGTFARAPMPPAKGARGGILADLDGDGDLDLYVFRTHHPLVFENDGTGAFTDRTPEAMRTPGEHRTEAGAVLDVDGDGRLDLYAANYERRPNPPWGRGTPDRLWRNLGGFGFEDATDLVGGISREPMCGRGAATADLDEDGDTDLYVANYRLDPDYLLLSEEGRLVNRARERGVEGECDEGWFGHGIGPAFGDLDGDGHLDVVVGNLAHPRYIGFSDVTRIFLSSGPPDWTFRDVFRESGVRYEETHSNASLADVDNDGDLDLFLTSVYRGRHAFLYENDGSARFTDVTWRAGVRIDNGWGSIFLDHDLDGDADLVVRTSGGTRLFRNDREQGGFVGLVLAGRESNGSGIGARAVLEGGGLRLVREVSGGTGTGCQDDPSIRFGVGERRGPFTITVRWPGGRMQRVMGVEPGAVHRLIEGGGFEKAR